MHNVTYRSFEIRIIVKVMQPRSQGFSLLKWTNSKGKSPGNEVESYGVINTHLLQTFFSSVFIFCVNSNCIREIIKKDMLSLIHLKNRRHTSFRQSFRVLKSDARFGTGTSLACARTVFLK